MKRGNTRMGLFTLEGANALLPWLKPRMAELMAIRQRVSRRQAALESIINQPHGPNGGNRAASEVVADMARFEQLVEEINNQGCLLKDINLGLVDFPAEMGNRIVYLCWQFGEEEIAWWHDVDAGFAGRQPL